MTVVTLLATPIPIAVAKTVTTALATGLDFYMGSFVVLGERGYSIVVFGEEVGELM